MFCDKELFIYINCFKEMYVNCWSKKTFRLKLLAVCRLISNQPKLKINWSNQNFSN